MAFFSGIPHRSFIKGCPRNPEILCITNFSCFLRYLRIKIWKILEESIHPVCAVVLIYRLNFVVATIPKMLVENIHYLKIYSRVLKFGIKI